MGRSISGRRASQNDDDETRCDKMTRVVALIGYEVAHGRHGYLWTGCRSGSATSRGGPAAIGPTARSVGVRTDPPTALRHGIQRHRALSSLWRRRPSLG